MELNLANEKFRLGLSLTFKLDKNIYKSTSGASLIDIADKETYSKILSFLNLKNISELKKEGCYSVVNNNNSPNFDLKKLPAWLFEKVEINDMARNKSAKSGSNH